MPGHMRIAIVGAGITGLQLALRLSKMADVTVFEKSRGFGGRMSTRRAGGFHFDHGAQYFTVRTPNFQRFLLPFLEAGTVAQWKPRLMPLQDGEAPVWNAPRYVAVPGMNALAKSMATGMNVLLATRIASLEKSGGLWRLVDEKGATFEGYDWVVSTAPAEQSALLLQDVSELGKTLNNFHMHGCYSLMIGYGTPQSVPWDAAIPESGPLSWIALNHSKPGRPDAFSVVCQSSNDWADAHLEDDQDTVSETLCQAFEALTGMPSAVAEYTSLHRWRYAKVSRPAGKPFLVDTADQLAAAGDWCGDGRVETGFESANALADFLCENT